MRGIFVLLFTVGSMAQAGASAHASELRGLLDARSLSELDSATREARELRQIHDGCRAELAARLLPRDCFREIAMRAGGSAAERSRTRSVEQQRMTRICIENARVSRSRLDLGAEMSGIPDECRKIADERLEDLRYMDEARRPADVSGWRTDGTDLE